MNQIRSIRKRLGMSQEALAASIGKTKASMSHYETGRYQLPVEDAKKIIRLASELGIALSLDDIYAAPQEAA